MSHRLSAKGFSLIESILASSLFALLVTGIIGALIYGQESVELSGRRNRALFIAQEGLEVASNMRDGDFGLLIDGMHGLAILNNQWTLSGTSDTTDGFTRTLAIASLDPDTKTVTSTVSWQSTVQRESTVSLESRLTNWSTPTTTQADQIIINTSQATISGSGKSELRGIEISNTGQTPAVIDRLTVSWTKPNQNIREVMMEETIVWSNTGPGTPIGSQSSATPLDIQNTTIPAGENDFEIDRIRMTGNASGDTFTLVFQFTDGSTKQSALSPPTP